MVNDPGRGTEKGGCTVLWTGRAPVTKQLKTHTRHTPHPAPHKQRYKQFREQVDGPHHTSDEGKREREGGAEAEEWTTRQMQWWWWWLSAEGGGDATKRSTVAHLNPSPPAQCDWKPSPLGPHHT